MVALSSDGFFEYMYIVWAKICVLHGTSPAKFTPKPGVPKTRGRGAGCGVRGAGYGVRGQKNEKIKNNNNNNNNKTTEIKRKQENN